MGKIIKFRQAGKNISRQKKDKQARENRIIFGRKKSEKVSSKKERQTLNAHLDSHKIDGHKIDGHKIDGHKIDLSEE